MTFRAVTQPSGGNNLDAIAGALASGGVERIDVAGAYATFGGVQPMIRTMEEALGATWNGIRKRWLIAFDYLRTEPIALSRLHALPNSRVRIHDGAAILARRCTPLVPFHPKTFIFRGAGRRAVLAGSGNLSRSGLTRGHEVGLLIDLPVPAGPREQAALAQCEAVVDWFDGLWAQATRLDQVLQSYTSIYEAATNLGNPTPTDDDTAPATTRGALTLQQLRRVRACRHLWIQTGNITRNRGPDLPGNQLMMKRMSRVFFGVPASDVAKDTHLATLSLTYAGQPTTCTLSYSNNGMDKLTLPIPGDQVPDWDQETMLITKQPNGTYALQLGSSTEVRSWRRRSVNLDTDFTMAGGRNWGTY